MDKCTHEIRKQQWKEIIEQCMQRPQGMTVKQWLDSNGICEQSYYRWLKLIRQEVYELTTSTKELPVKAKQAEVSFAEIPLHTIDAKANAHYAGFQPDITINTGLMVLGISNTASEALLNKVFEVIGYAR